MLKLTTLMNMDDHQAHGDNDLRYEGGVAPVKHVTGRTHGDETATHSVLPMDEAPTEIVTHHPARPWRCTPLDPNEPPGCHRFEYTDQKPIPTTTSTIVEWFTASAT